MALILPATVTTNTAATSSTPTTSSFIIPTGNNNNNNQPTLATESMVGLTSITGDLETSLSHLITAAADHNNSEMHGRPGSSNGRPISILGGAVGALVVLVIAVVVITVVIRRCKRNPNENKETEMKENDHMNAGCE